MEVRGKSRGLILLLAFLFLATILIPHQHHADGSPCFESIHHSMDADAHEADDCASHGHNVMYQSDDHQAYVKAMDTTFFFFPLYAVYPLLSLITPGFYPVPWEYPDYAESIYRIQLVCGLGLRAPPSL